MNEDQPCNTEPCREPEPVQKARGILIESLDYGFKVKVGCQNFAVESLNKLLINIEAYLNDPLETEKKWNSDKSLL